MSPLLPWRGGYASLAYVGCTWGRLQKMTQHLKQSYGGGETLLLLLMNVRRQTYRRTKTIRFSNLLRLRTSCSETSRIYLISARQASGPKYITWLDFTCLKKGSWAKQTSWHSVQSWLWPILLLLHVQHAAPVVVPPADLPTVDLVPGDGLRLGHALVIADQKVKICCKWRAKGSEF